MQRAPSPRTKHYAAEQGDRKARRDCVWTTGSDTPHPSGRGCDVGSRHGSEYAPGSSIARPTLGTTARDMRHGRAAVVSVLYR
jgi:hypothetical protein